MLKKLFQRKAKVSEPQEVSHVVHIDSELNWEFDDSFDPTTIFRKIKVLGKGRFGVVYEVEHIPSQKLFAGKLINSSLLNEESKLEVQNEIRSLRYVDSPYTVHYYGCVPFEGSLMILMENCDCGSLRDLLDRREQVLSEDQIGIVLVDLLRGLHLIHTRHRIIHRDIKSANILLTSDSGIRIADFGVSRKFEPNGTCHTMTIVGTPYWMAPEVISGISYDFTADIWSVGITAVELSEGAPPYIELPPTKAMVEIALNGFPGFRYPYMHSSEFCDFVSHCVETNPRDRWTIEQLLDHPFLQRASRLDRNEIMAELIKEGQERQFEEKFEDTPTFRTMDLLSQSESDLGLHQIDIVSASNFDMNSGNVTFDTIALALTAKKQQYVDSINLNEEQIPDRKQFYADSSSFANSDFLSEPSSFNMNTNSTFANTNMLDSTFNADSTYVQNININDSTFVSDNSPFSQMNTADSTFVSENSPFTQMNTADSTFVASASPFDSLSMDNIMNNQNNNINNNNNSQNNIKNTQSNAPKPNTKTVRFMNAAAPPPNTRKLQSHKPVHTLKQINSAKIPDNVFVEVTKMMSLNIPYVPLKTEKQEKSTVTYKKYAPQNIVMKRDANIIDENPDELDLRSLVYLIQKGIMFSQIEEAASSSASTPNHQFEEDLDSLKNSQQQSVEMIQELSSASCKINIGMGNQQNRFNQFYLNSQSALILEAHNQAAIKSCWSHKSEFLATGGIDGKVIIWKFDPNENYIYDNPNIIDVGSDVTTLCWSEEEPLLAVGTFLGSIKLIDTENITHEFNFEEFPILSMQFNAAFLAAVNNNGHVFMIDKRTGSLVKEWHIEGTDPTDVLWRSESNLLVGCAKDVIECHSDGSIKQIFTAKTDIIQISMNDDGSYLAVGDESGKVTFLDKSDKVKYEHNLHESSVCSISWSPNNNALATGGADGFVKVIDLNESEPSLFDGHPAAAYIVAYDPQERYIASVGAENFISIWSIQTNQLIVKYMTDVPINDICWSTDGKYLSICLHSGEVAILNFDILC
ncbi:STE family protein kinase [Histomonas meleagridis]|uniref:STE family protein kinase n=1 Tax=Histomonas meleagridis TaxID=135588 RepID=UPI00355A245E|nr:STE family protein kinase [Histomonas meleagridis]KAH0806720.1 STE family protein kinase [Histomonas meleagridis]